MSFDRDHGLHIDYEPYSSGKSSPDETRARLSDITRIEPLQHTVDQDRATIDSWLSWKSGGFCQEPCGDCPRRIAADRDEMDALSDQEWTYCWEPGVFRGYQMFKPCEKCRGEHAYLTKFSRDWLVDVMLNHFGGDISRVPTLDELKGLL